MRSGSGGTEPSRLPSRGASAAGHNPAAAGSCVVGYCYRTYCITRGRNLAAGLGTDSLCPLSLSTLCPLSVHSLCPLSVNPLSLSPDVHGMINQWLCITPPPWWTGKSCHWWSRTATMPQEEVFSSSPSPCSLARIWIRESHLVGKRKRRNRPTLGTCFCLRNQCWLSLHISFHVWPSPESRSSWQLHSSRDGASNRYCCTFLGSPILSCAKSGGKGGSRG